MRATAWAGLTVAAGLVLYVQVPEARAYGDDLGRHVLGLVSDSSPSTRATAPATGRPGQLAGATRPALAMPGDMPRALAAARTVRTRYGVPVSVTLGQAMLESGGAGLDSGLAKGHRNYFGVKCAGGSIYASGCATLSTVDWSASSGYFRHDAAFRTYRSPEASFLDYGRVVSLPRYVRAHQCNGDPECFIRSVAAGGYAGPTYAASVLTVIDRNHLRRYDR